MANAGLVYDHDSLPETCHEDGHVPGCPGRAGGDHELDHEPEARWNEDDPRPDDNHEGDPAWNGAFDRW